MGLFHFIEKIFNDFRNISYVLHWENDKISPDDGYLPMLPFTSLPVLGMVEKAGSCLTGATISL